MKKCLLVGFGMLIALLLGGAAVRCFSPCGEERDGGERIIRGCGFVRGIGQVTLRNKYAGFVWSMMTSICGRRSRHSPIRFWN